MFWMIYQATISQMLPAETVMTGIEWVKGELDEKDVSSSIIQVFILELFSVV